MLKKTLLTGLIGTSFLFAYINNNGDNYNYSINTNNYFKTYKSSKNYNYVGPYAYHKIKQFKDPLFNFELEFNKPGGDLNNYDGFSIKVNNESTKYNKYNGKYSYSIMKPKGEINFYNDSDESDIYSGIFGLNNQVNIDLNTNWRVSVGVEAGVTYGKDNNSSNPIMKDNTLSVATNNYMVGITNGFNGYANVNLILTYATKKYDVKATIGAGIYDVKNKKSISYENIVGRFFWTKDLFNYLSLTHNNSASESPDTIMFGFGFPFWR